MTRQVASLMDLFPTVLKMAGIDVPKGLTLDGMDLTPVIFRGVVEEEQQLVEKTFERPIFHYRGNELFAVRFGLHKAHLWTWTNGWDEMEEGIDFCPGQFIAGVTSHIQRNHTLRPIIFHLGCDPGEKFPLKTRSSEYVDAFEALQQVVDDHRREMAFGLPVLNWCDEAVQNWAPKGCEELGQCLKAPLSKPFRCVWPH